MSGNILVVSGPSGSGKSSLVNELMQKLNNCYFSISTTTREKRGNEQHGVEYFFITKDEFEKGIEKGLFLEWAKVHGNYYGTSLLQIEEALKNDKLVIFDIDVQGHKIVREKFDKITTSVFITTPSREILKQRLEKRSIDSKETIEKRLKNALDEMERIHEYDYFLINDDFDSTLDIFISIAKASRHKSSLFDQKKVKKGWVKG